MIRRPPAVTATRTTPAPAPAPAPAAVAPAFDPVQYMQMLQQMYANTQVQAPVIPAMPQYPEMPLVKPDLGPEDIAYFDALEQRANQTYHQGLAQNAYQQGTLGIENSITERDLSDRFNKTRDQLPGQYQRRGLMNSGIYQSGLGDYANARNNATTDLARRFQNQMGGLQLAQQQLTATHGTTMPQIAASRNARRNAIASTIRTVR